MIVAASVVATVVAVAALCLTASERVNVEIERARVANLLNTLKAAAEASLSIGLALDQASLLQARIEREKAGDPSILAIDVFNATGRAIYSTDRSVIGESVTGDWVRRLSDSGQWQTRERSDTVFGTHFENDLGLAGGIAITVSDETRTARSDTLGLDLFGRTLALAVAGGFLALVGAIGFAYAMARPFDRVARILSGEVASPTPDESIEQMATLARQSWAQAEVRVDRGLGQLGALDDAA